MPVVAKVFPAGSVPPRGTGWWVSGPHAHTVEWCKAQAARIGYLEMTERQFEGNSGSWDPLQWDLYCVYWEDEPERNEFGLVSP